MGIDVHPSWHNAACLYISYPRFAGDYRRRTPDWRTSSATFVPYHGVHRTVKNTSCKYYD